MEVFLEYHLQDSVSEERLRNPSFIALAGKELLVKRGMQWSIAVEEYGSEFKKTRTDVSAWFQSRPIRGRLWLKGTGHTYSDAENRIALQFAKNFAELLALKFSAN